MDSYHRRPFDNAQGRRSIRLKDYDYSQSGTYYVTIVTWHRDLLFGEVKEGKTILNEIGKVADECWRAIPEHFPNVELGAYVVMPNHMHGIIYIHQPVGATHGDRLDTIYDVGAAHAHDGRGTTPALRAGASVYRAPTENIEQFGKPVKGSLPTIVRTYKAAVTRRVGRELNATGIWQRNYYEHIIRDEKDLQNKTDYIEANPSLWDEDENNPIHPLP